MSNDFVNSNFTGGKGLGLDAGFDVSRAAAPSCVSVDVLLAMAPKDLGELIACIGRADGIGNGCGDRGSIQERGTDRPRVNADNATTAVNADGATTDPSGGNCNLMLRFMAEAARAMPGSRGRDHKLVHPAAQHQVTKRAYPPIANAT